jgi:hypothetical protein
MELLHMVGVALGDVGSMSLWGEMVAAVDPGQLSSDPGPGEAGEPVGFFDTLPPPVASTRNV